MFNAGWGQEVLQSAQPHLDSLTVTLPQLSQEVQHGAELRIPHVLLWDEDAECWSTIQSPAPGDELQLSLDILGQQSHVVWEVELWCWEYERVAENCFTRDSVQFTGAQRSWRWILSSRHWKYLQYNITYRSGWPPIQSQLTMIWCTSVSLWWKEFNIYLMVQGGPFLRTAIRFSP